MAGLRVCAEEGEDPQAGETFRENHPVVALKLWFFFWYSTLGQLWSPVAAQTGAQSGSGQDLQPPSRTKTLF